MAAQSGEDDPEIQNVSDIVYGDPLPFPLHLFQAPSLPPPQTIESFACKVRYFSIIRFVMGSLSSTLSASLPLWLTKLMVWEVPLLCQTQFHIACCSEEKGNCTRGFVLFEIPNLTATVLTI